MTDQHTNVLIALYDHDEPQGCYHLAVDDETHPYCAEDHADRTHIGTFHLDDGSPWHGPDVTHVRSVFTPEEAEQLLERAETETGFRAAVAPL